MDLLQGEVKKLILKGDLCAGVVLQDGSEVFLEICGDNDRDFYERSYARGLRQEAGGRVGDKPSVRAVRSACSIWLRGKAFENRHPRKAVKRYASIGPRRFLKRVTTKFILSAIDLHEAQLHRSSVIDSHD